MLKIIMRKAEEKDVKKVGALYDQVTLHQLEEGNYTSWQHKKYPCLQDAEESFKNNSLFVYHLGEDLLGSVVLDHLPHPVYSTISWGNSQDTPQDDALIVHRLALSPLHMRKGYGAEMMLHVLDYGRQQGIPAVRLDTGIINLPAQGLYEKIGFTKRGTGILDFSDRDPLNVCFYEYIL